jgi:transketolase
MELGSPNLEEFAATVLELAQQNSDVLIMTSDSRGSGQLTTFAKALPDQLIEIGIAEQDLVGIAAGLASAGKKVFVVSPACFLTARSLEQIKNDVAYSDQPVKLIGISAGVSYGALGSTHHSLHDFAALRSINNIDVVAPADNFETRETIQAAVNHPRPIYVRFGKKPAYHLHTPDTHFEIGKALPLSTGSDVTFIATGETVSRAAQARELLEREGMSCGVISMHTVKPLDAEALLDAAYHSGALVTVEEHSIYGGLGEACAAVLLQHNVNLAFKIVGIPDEYTVTGSQAEILEHYGISPQGLADIARQLLRSLQFADWRKKD